MSLGDKICPLSYAGNFTRNCNSECAWGDNGCAILDIAAALTRLDNNLLVAATKEKHFILKDFIFKAEINSEAV